MKRAHPEQDLHKAVAQFLAVALAGNSWWSTMPLGGGGYNHGARNKQLGTVKGLPDLLVVNDGRARFLELKSPKGRVSAAQHEAHRKLRQAGATVDVCYSLDEVIHALLSHGVPLRGGNGWLWSKPLEAPTEPTRTSLARSPTSISPTGRGSMSRHSRPS